MKLNLVHKKILLVLGSVKSYIVSNKWVLSILAFQFITISYVLLNIYFGSKLGLFDYGLETQVLHNTSLGKWFQSSYEVSNYLGDHFSLIILLFAPLYRLFSFGFTPIILQNICFVVGMLGVYTISNKLFKNKFISTVLVAFFSFYYPAQSFLLFHYHPIVFSFPFLIWGIYFLFYKPRYIIATILLIVAMLGKEDIGLTIAFIFLYKFLGSRNWKFLLLSLFAFVYTFLAVKYFIPAFRGGPQDSVGYFSYLGDSIPNIIKNLLTNRVVFYDAFLSGVKIKYLLLLFTPVLFLPFFSRKIFLLFPSVIINYMTNPGSNLLLGQHQYDVISSAIIFCISVEGLYNISNYIKQKNLLKTLKPHIFNLIFGVSVATLLFIPNYNNIFGSKNRVLNDITGDKPSYQQYNELKYLQSKIPINSVVLIDLQSGAYFSKFPNSKCYPGECGEVKQVKFEELESAILLKSIVDSNSKYNLMFEDGNFRPKFREETDNFVMYSI